MRGLLLQDGGLGASRESEIRRLFAQSLETRGSMDVACWAGESN
jgi:hypothetical protein